MWTFIDIRTLWYEWNAFQNWSCEHAEKMTVRLVDNSFLPFIFRARTLSLFLVLYHFSSTNKKVAGRPTGERKLIQGWANRRQEPLGHNWIQGCVTLTTAAAALSLSFFAADTTAIITATAQRRRPRCMRDHCASAGEKEDVKWPRWAETVVYP